MNVEKLTGSHILRSAYNVSRELGHSIFLVGGAVRDLFLSSRSWKDLDFAVGANPRKIAGLLAHRVGGGFFCLDPQRGHYRISIKEDDTIIKKIDLSEIRGRDIHEDLIMRDFTINSMAIDLKDLFEENRIRIIDPLGGMEDMETGRVRASYSKVFDDDPLRLIRGVRMAAFTGLSFEEDTERLIKRKRELLNKSSWERVRDELFQILNNPSAHVYIHKLDSLGLLNVVFPEVTHWRDIDQGEHHDYNLLDHSIKTIEYVEAIFSDLSDHFTGYADRIEEHFNEELEDNVTRANLIKLIAFLHDSGKADTKSLDGEKVRFFGHDRVGEQINKTIAKRLKLGRKATRIIADITKNHMRILSLSCLEKITPRARYRFFRDLDKEVMDCLLLAMADEQATRISATPTQRTPLVIVIRDFLEYYFEVWLNASKTPLLNGREIMELVGILQGKDVGRFLSLIKEAEGEGLISTREEAKDLVRLHSISPGS